MFIQYTVGAIAGLFFSYIGLMIAGAGGVEGFYLVGIPLLLAYSGVIFYIIRQVKIGKGLPSAFILISPIFLVAGCLGLIGIIGNTFSLLIPDSAAFASECKTAGAKFIKLPDSPVHSIAYDWNTTSPPPFNYFSVNYGTRISLIGSTIPPHPKSIEYVERKRDYRVRESEGSYKRVQHKEREYIISELTADVLVQYQINPEEELKKAMINQGVVRYDVTVIDRRTGELLASLRYIIDKKKGRACGFTEKNNMSVGSFVIKAVGL